jgi:hypothetical protein
MKNLHILETDKPSRLALHWFANTYSLFSIEKKFTMPFKSKHIYITKFEDIKEGVDQWYLDKVLNEPYNSGGAQYASKQDIIVLTTDPELIKDGVQSIQVEFLEWFVENSTCESVEVKRIANGVSNHKLTYDYKIIIPKKNFYCGNEVDYDEQCLNQCENCVDKKGVDYGYLPYEEAKQEICPICKKNFLINGKCLECTKVLSSPLGLKQETFEDNKQARLVKELANDLKSKQETVEEYFLDNIKNMLQFKNDALAIRFMEKYFHAKKEQERLYDDEELIQTLIKFNQEIYEVEDVREWFKKFKNK